MMVQTDDDAVLQRIESRLRWLALALCAVVAVAVAAWCGSSAQATRDRQSLQRAEALAQRLATRISAALAVGIPFDRLQGVEVAFEHALEQKTGMRRIVLLDANEAMVHEASVPAGPARIAANVYARAAVHRTDPQGREQRAGTVVVESVANDDARFGWDMTLLLLASVSIGALSVSELWRWKLWSGPGVRVRVLRRARELMANGDWTVLPDAEPPTRHGGIRAYAARVHALTERHHRIRRLTASLASTEPARDERTRLQNLAGQARGQDRFPVRGPDRAILSSDGHDVRAVCFLMLFASEGMRTGLGRVATDTGPWFVVIYAAAAWAGQRLAAWLAQSPLAGRMGSAPALIVLAIVFNTGGWLLGVLWQAGPEIWISRALSAAGVGMVLGVASAFWAARAPEEPATQDRGLGTEWAIRLAGEWGGPLFGFIVTVLWGPAAAAVLLVAIAGATGWRVCAAIAQRTPWPQHWPDRADEPTSSSDRLWRDAADAARGALLAWLVMRTAEGAGQQQLGPAALWLAYGAGSGLAVAPWTQPLLHRVARQGLQIGAAVLGMAAAGVLLALPRGDGTDLVAVLTLACVGSIGLCLGLVGRVAAHATPNVASRLAGPRWLALAVGALMVALVSHASHAA